MTREEIDALDSIRCRLSHTEAICGLVAAHDQSEVGEAMRGIQCLIEDAVTGLDKMIDPIVGTSMQGR